MRVCSTVVLSEISYHRFRRGCLLKTLPKNKLSSHPTRYDTPCGAVQGLGTGPEPSAPSRPKPSEQSGRSAGAKAGAGPARFLLPPPPPSAPARRPQPGHRDRRPPRLYPREVTAVPQNAPRRETEPAPHTYRRSEPCGASPRPAARPFKSPCPAEAGGSTAHRPRNGGRPSARAARRRRDYISQQAPRDVRGKLPGLQRGRLLAFLLVVPRARPASPCAAGLLGVPWRCGCRAAAAGPGREGGARCRRGWDGRTGRCPAGGRRR